MDIKIFDTAATFDGLPHYLDNHIIVLDEAAGGGPPALFDLLSNSVCTTTPEPNSKLLPIVGALNLKHLAHMVPTTFITANVVHKSRFDLVIVGFKFQKEQSSSQEPFLAGVD